MLKRLDLPTKHNAIIISEDDILNAIEMSNGTMISVGMILGVHHQIAKQNVQYYNSTIIAYELNRSRIIDIAEYAMVNKIKDGDPTLIKFALQTLAKDIYGNQGLVIDGNGNAVQININTSKDTDEEDVIDITKIGKIGI